MLSLCRIHSDENHIRITLRYRTLIDSVSIGVSHCHPCIAISEEICFNTWIIRGPLPWIKIQNVCRRFVTGTTSCSWIWCRVSSRTWSRVRTRIPVQDSVLVVHEDIELAFLHRACVVGTGPLVTGEGIVPCSTMRKFHTDILDTRAEVSEHCHVCRAVRGAYEHISSRPVIDRNIPSETGTEIIEGAVLLSEGKKLRISIVQTASDLILSFSRNTIIIVIPTDRLVCRTISACICIMELSILILIDGVVISQLSELPDHLRARNKKAESRTKSCPSHPHFKIVLHTFWRICLLFVAKTFLVMALHERHDRPERHSCALGMEIRKVAVA